tara:strand:+ start:697 stop:1830 length:1134 start_codon:yes stop_codon:yes gene_type:complete
MIASDYKEEFNQINKILKSYNQNSLKDTLLFANVSKSKLPELNNIPQYHNIVGLINFRLNDLEQSISDFETAINLNPNFHSSYYNLGLLYFKTKNLKKSFNFLIKAMEIKNDYKLARDKIIEILSFYEPEDEFSNSIVNLNNKIKQVPFKIDFSKKITDLQIINYFKSCKKVVSQNLEDLSYNKVQIYRNKSINLNCERHKAIFSKYNSIPKYCFECYKVVIESKNFYDLLKMSLIFDQLTYFQKFNRKNMIDKKSETDIFKSIIYCTSLDEVFDVENKTKQILNIYFDDRISIVSKRGCHEYASKYPEYKKIFRKKSKMMPYPDEWLQNEKEYDLENTKNGIESIGFAHDTKKGISLNNFLIMNNWFNDQKIFFES